MEPGACVLTGVGGVDKSMVGWEAGSGACTSCGIFPLYKMGFFSLTLF